MSKVKRSRAFVFTFNNYTPEDESRIQSINCKYCIYGRETAPTTGTPHLQGYIYFPNARAKRGVERAIGGETRLWIEEARGDSLNNYDYSTKDDASYFEKGERPATAAEAGQAEKQRWEAARVAAMEGRYSDIPADMYIRYQSSFKRMRREDLPPPGDLEPNHSYGIWIYGPPRTGKSHMARTQYQPLYLKDINKWWDGYDGQDNVLIDEFAPEHAQYMTGFMKKWVDRWTFSAETKGARTVIRPKLIIVTSNYSIEDVWPQGVDRDAMLSRFKVIHKSQREDGAQTQIQEGFAESEVEALD